VIGKYAVFAVSEIANGANGKNRFVWSDESSMEWEEERDRFQFFRV
jgi:hypothetical protein